MVESMIQNLSKKILKLRELREIRDKANQIEDEGSKAEFFSMINNMSMNLKNHLEELENIKNELMSF